jgi:hypothetical protein
VWSTGADMASGHRRPRQLAYDIAVGDEYVSWRQWLDEQLALLPAEDANAMAHRIWLDEHFWTVNFELLGSADRCVDLASSTLNVGQWYVLPHNAVTLRRASGH